MLKMVIIILALSLLILYSCGGKPGGLKSFEEIIPEFVERLNEACAIGTFGDVMKLFDRKAVILVSPEINPEVFHGPAQIRDYFHSIPLDTHFEIGKVLVQRLRAETEYTYKQKNGAVGKGLWIFKLTNMGKIGELTIAPGETSQE